MGNYLNLPSGRKALALETRKLIDDYLGRKITFEQAQEQVSFWAYNTGEFMFDGDKWNPTYALHLGKKRLAIVEKLLPPMQLKLQ